MELSQSETLRILDEHHRRVCNIDPHLDHRRANQCFGFSAAKTFHDLLLLRRRDAAMQQLTAIWMQSFAPCLILRCCRFCIQLLAFVDQRIDHVNLPPEFQLRPQEYQNFAELGFVAYRSDYFPTIARHLIDH